MSGVIISYSIIVAQWMLSLAMFLALLRLLRGPAAQDRIMALDALYVIAMIFFIIFGIKTQTEIYFETAFIIGLLGFVSSAALAKFLMRGEVIE